MSTTAERVPAEFPLDTIGAAVDKIVLPEGPFDPAGPWQLRYGAYSTAGVPGRVGELRLRRVVKPGGRVLLDLAYQKRLSGGSQQIAAKIHLPADGPLSTPDDWSFQAHVLDTSGKIIEQTRIRKSAVVRDGTLAVRRPAGTKKIPLQGRYSLNWALFDAVGRLPADRLEPIRFTLIDHFDQLKPGHTLGFRAHAGVTLGGRKCELHAYDQHGRGLVPCVWWVDGRGRLLAAVSGLEAYLLESAANIRQTRS